MPLLALRLDSRQRGSYGAVYAVAETAVSLAYCLGPAAAGLLQQTLGFAWLMRCVALANLLCAAPLCWLLHRNTEVQNPEEMELRIADHYTRLQEPFSAV
ncbi:synaptic vesicular amine transporter-like [Rhipicephalus microplus]|uniref:synaptic vesicular amine transporter-like n=1 Tax=Rhipicephalus microplus TaxID=6941 RepID=UPI003F6D2FB8